MPGACVLCEAWQSSQRRAVTHLYSGACLSSLTTHSGTFSNQNIIWSRASGNAVVGWGSAPLWLPLELRDIRWLFKGCPHFAGEETVLKSSSRAFFCLNSFLKCPTQQKFQTQLRLWFSFYAETVLGRSAFQLYASITVLDIMHDLRFITKGKSFRRSKSSCLWVEPLVYCILYV